MNRDLPQPDPENTVRRRAHLRPGHLLLVFLGGAAGTAGREAVNLLLPSHQGFPTATFAVNILGALLLGLLLESLGRFGGSPGRARRMRLLLGTGFMGGFTTYSTLAVDGALLLGTGSAGLGALYALGSIVLGAAASWCGILLGAARTRRNASGEASR
ncbi:fluoride efflux transporter FluC [Glutamicibacter protophormiae]